MPMVRLTLSSHVTIMVNNSQKRQDKPSYSLDRIRELASREQVVTENRRVLRQSQNIGYTFDDICRCLAKLDAKFFKESILYEDSADWRDVYLVPNQHGKWSDDLYIKLRLNRNCLVVLVDSFHLEGQQ
jgi:hypothetical protein